AEDGIRDRNVTGVQTCALPISRPNDDVLRGPARSGHGLVHDRRFSDKRSDTHERLLRSGARVRPAVPQRRRNRHSHGLHRPDLSLDSHRVESVLRALVSARYTTRSGSRLALRGLIPQWPPSSQSVVECSVWEMTDLPLTGTFASIRHSQRHNLPFLREVMALAVVDALLRGGCEAVATLWHCRCGMVRR